MLLEKKEVSWLPRVPHVIKFTFTVFKVGPNTLLNTLRERKRNWSRRRHFIGKDWESIKDWEEERQILFPRNVGKNIFPHAGLEKSEARVSGCHHAYTSWTCFLNVLLHLKLKDSEVYFGMRKLLKEQQLLELTRRFPVANVLFDPPPPAQFILYLKSLCKHGMVESEYDPGTGVEVWGWRDPGQPGLPSEFQVTWGCVTRLCLKDKSSSKTMKQKKKAQHWKQRGELLIWGEESWQVYHTAQLHRNLCCGWDGSLGKWLGCCWTGCGMGQWLPGHRLQDWAASLAFHLLAVTHYHVTLLVFYITFLSLSSIFP